MKKQNKTKTLAGGYCMKWCALITVPVIGLWEFTRYWVSFYEFNVWFISCIVLLCDRAWGIQCYLLAQLAELCFILPYDFIEYRIRLFSNPLAWLWLGMVVTFNNVSKSFNLFKYHYRVCLNNPISSNLGLCAACWSCFMCHDELWPTS